MVGCRCRCHNVARGNLEGARQIGDWADAMRLSYDPSVNALGWADVTEPLDAAVATGCPCAKNHVWIFSAFKPPEGWTPESEAE